MNDLEIRRLRREGYSEEAIENYKKFGRRTALLQPYIGRPVNTPKGSGTLHQAIGDTALVVLDREKRKERYSEGAKPFRPMSEVLVEEVRP